MVRKILRKIYLEVLDKTKGSAARGQAKSPDDVFLRERWDGSFGVFGPDKVKLYFQKRENIMFFIDALRIKNNLTFITSCFPDMLLSIIESSENVISHVFDLLGSGTTDLGKDLDWHTDFKTGKGWPVQKYYRSIEMLYERADMKVPWELSRFQHLMVLAEAYMIKPDEKYAREFVDQTSGWISNNPVSSGVNWKCAMECSIRVLNWISAFYCFKDSKTITNNFTKKFIRSILEHGEHIMGNLEKRDPFSTNHYLADLLGLIAIGTMFPEFTHSKKWADFSIRQLASEMRKQVYADGCDYEGSVCYHALVLEIFFFSTLIPVINHKDFKGGNFVNITEKIFGRDYTRRLYDMFDSLVYIMKPNGFIPQIGDNDSGRIIKLSDRDNLDRKDLLALGAVFFKESKWKIKEFFTTEEELMEMLLIFGDQGRKIWDQLNWNYLKNIKSRAFEKAGWYVIRDKKNYCCISCGANGQGGTGGHAHNDKLSFELSLDNCDIIIDPGTYVYSADRAMRNFFRSTKAHNTVLIDKQEINRFNPEKIFLMSEDAHPKVSLWETDPDNNVFEGEHSGYRRLPGKITHQRRIIYCRNRGVWMISDTITGQGMHLYETFFHFGDVKLEKGVLSGVMVEKVKDISSAFNLRHVEPLSELTFTIVDPKGQEYLFVPLVDAGTEIRIFEDWVSPSYGIKTKKPVVKYMSELLSPCRMDYVICSI